jgi:hypothetical protein
MILPNHGYTTDGRSSDRRRIDVTTQDRPEALGGPKMKEAHATRPHARSHAIRPHAVEVHTIKAPNRSARVKLATTLGAALALGVMGSSAAAAAGPDISIRLDEVTFASPGTVVALEQAVVPTALQGQVCTATYAGANNSSVHPGTELVITSNGDTIVLTGVEEVAGAVTSATGRLTLGPTVTVSVRIGTDGLSSLGASLDLTCAPAGPDTTPATAVTTVITEPTTTAAATVPTSAASTVPGPSVSATVAVAPPPMVSSSTTTLVASGGPVPPAVSTATTSPASTTPATGTAGTLPATGSNTPGWLLGAGGVLVLTGLAAMTARRGDRRPV